MQPCRDVNSYTPQERNATQHQDQIFVKNYNSQDNQYFMIILYSAPRLLLIEWLGYRLKDREIRVLFLREAKLPVRSLWESSGKCVHLPTCLHLVPRLRKCGAVFPLPLTSSWRSVYLKTGIFKFPFVFYLNCSAYIIQNF